MRQRAYPWVTKPHAGPFEGFGKHALLPRLSRCPATTRDSKTPTIVVSSVRQSAGVRLDSAAYLDGSGRTRETQTASGGLNGFAAWPNLPTTAGTLNTVVSVFDTANRVTSTSRKYGTTTLVTGSSVYLGTRTETTPQIGSKSAKVVDAYDRTTRAEVYNGATVPVPGSVTNGGTVTTMAYTCDLTTGLATSGFQTVTVTDDGLYQRVSVSDLAGRAVSSTDPDAGTTTVGYDSVGNVVKIDDAGAVPVWVSYDVLNRPLLRWANATGSAPASNSEKLAEWVYDGPSGTAAAGFKGLVVKEISWQARGAYTTEVMS